MKFHLIFSIANKRAETQVAGTPLPENITDRGERENGFLSGSMKGPKLLETVLALEGSEYKNVGIHDKYDKKFRPLVDELAPEETKFEQILQWAEKQEKDKS